MLYRFITSHGEVDNREDYYSSRFTVATTTRSSIQHPSESTKFSDHIKDDDKCQRTLRNLFM